MASSKLKRDYPYLAAYLDANHRNPIADRLMKAQTKGCTRALTIPMIAAFAGAATLVVMGQPILAILGFFGLLIGGTAGVFLYTRNKVRKESIASTEEEEILAKNVDAVRVMRKLDEDRKFTKWMDPVAIQLLEAGAYHWSRINKSFEGSTWRANNLADHWLTMRDRAQMASTLAMAELAILCSGCTGEPAKNRKDDWQSVVDDLVDLDIEDALRGLARSAATHPKEYRYQSPRTKEIFEPARRLAENLKAVADEIEQSSPLAVGGGSTLRDSLAKSSLDDLLGEIRQIREAEQELGRSD
jgi:predicted DCC family thiol-disulfide oxidoreductase YuxK